MPPIDLSPLVRLRPRRATGARAQATNSSWAASRARAPSPLPAPSPTCPDGPLLLLLMALPGACAHGPVLAPRSSLLAPHSCCATRRLRVRPTHSLTGHLESLPVVRSDATSASCLARHRCHDEPRGLRPATAKGWSDSSAVSTPVIPAGSELLAAPAACDPPDPSLAAPESRIIPELATEMPSFANGASAKVA